MLGILKVAAGEQEEDTSLPGRLRLGGDVADSADADVGPPMALSELDSSCETDPRRQGSLSGFGQTLDQDSKPGRRELRRAAPEHVKRQPLREVPAPDWRQIRVARPRILFPSRADVSAACPPCTSW